jgi:hypothetical protein
VSEEGGIWAHTDCAAMRTPTANHLFIENSLLVTGDDASPYRRRLVVPGKDNLNQVTAA